jgi:hypothetical protein
VAADCVGSPVMLTAVSPDLTSARILHATELSFRPKKKDPSPLDELKADVYEALPNFLALALGVAAEGKPLIDISSNLGHLTVFPVLNDRILDTTFELKPGYRVDLNKLTEVELNPKVFGFRAVLSFRASNGDEQGDNDVNTVLLFTLIGILSFCLLCVGVIAVAAILVAVRARRGGGGLGRTGFVGSTSQGAGHTLGKTRSRRSSVSRR